MDEIIKEIIKFICIVLVILIAFFLVLRGLVAYSHDTTWRNDNFCKLKYGTEERGYEEFFGKFCAKVNYENHSVEKLYYTQEEMMDFCGRMGFWEFTKWKGKCASSNDKLQGVENE